MEAIVEEVIANARLQSKNDAQRKALHILNRRVRIQRLQLRRINELGRGLTAAEWVETKELYAAELEDSDWIQD